MITEDEFEKLKVRKDVETRVKYKYLEEKSQVFNAKMQEEYSYYICDYCKKEIKITAKWEEKTGGIITIPCSMTGYGKLKLALHNSCLKSMLHELEMLRERRRIEK